MSLLEKLNSMKMPFAELKGVKFVEADRTASSPKCWYGRTFARCITPSMAAR